MRIDLISQTPIQTDFGEMLKNLEAGDTVRGRVLEASSSQVTVKTPTGQVFTAALLAEVELQKGAFIELLINNISDGRAFAEIKETGSQAPDTSTKLGDLLVRLNIPANLNNLEAAKLLVKYNLPLDKETLTTVVNLQKGLASLGESKSEGLVGLLLSGMDVKNTPVDMLNRIVLASEAEVKKLIEGQEQNNKPGTTVVSNTAEEGSEPKANMAASRPSIPYLDSSAEKAIINVLKSVAGELDSGKEIRFRVTDNEQPQQENKSGAAKTEVSQATPNKSSVLQTIHGKAEAVAAKSNAIANDLEQLLGKLDIEKNGETAKLVANVANTLAVLDKEGLEQIVFLLSKGMEATPKNLSALEGNINNTQKVSEFLDKLQAQIDKYDRQDLKEIREEIQKLFLKPEQLEDKNKAKERIKDVVRLGEKLESTLSKGGISDPEIRNTLTNLKDNIDFVKSINEYSNYLQLPVTINNRNTTTDIYVFRENKKGKKIDPNNATILIALDLKYAGHIESLVNVSNKSVNITFRLQDKSVGALISIKTNDLKASLEARGYNLNPIKVIQLEQSFNLLSLEKMMNEGSVDRLHFDAKI